MWDFDHIVIFLGYCGHKEESNEVLNDISRKFSILLLWM